MKTVVDNVNFLIFGLKNYPLIDQQAIQNGMYYRDIDTTYTE